MVVAGYAVAAVGYVLLTNRGELAGAMPDLGLVAASSLVLFAAVRHVAREARRVRADLVQRERVLAVQQERVLVGATAAAVAHDANNVLVALLGEIDGLVAGGEVPQLDASVSHLRSGVERLVALNGRLLGLPLERSRQDLVRVTRDVLVATATHAAVAGCRLAYNGPEVAIAETHPLLIHQILGNLILNAAEATGGRGCIEVRIVDAAEQVALEVHDDGPGVPKELRHSLFDGFRTTKPGGAGLGLFSVRSCAQILGGSVAVDESPLGGARFRVVLPRA